MTAEALPQIEWDFGSVPDAELVACCYWEYARESAFIRSVRERCLDPKWREMMNSEVWDYCGRDIEKVQSIGYESEVILRGFFLEADAVNQSQDEKLPNYRAPDAPAINGSFPAAWQSLSEDERNSRAQIRSFVEQFQIVPIKLGHWGWGKDIAQVGQRRVEEQHEQRKNWEKVYVRRDEKGIPFTLPEAPKPPEFEKVRPRVCWGSMETLMVDIAWGSFTNDEIANYFRKWVKHARPKEIPNMDGKGRNKAGDWRAKLTRLAVMRLLARFSPLEIIDPRRNRFPAVWKTNQFAGAKWADSAKWHDARREAGQLFRKIFPFLPPNEKPLSWERQKPGK